MDGGGEEGLEVEDDSMDDLIRDRFRITAICIAEAEGKRNGMEIGGPVVACVADLAFKYAGNHIFLFVTALLRNYGRNYFADTFVENVAKDLELFAHHAGRKVVNMDDVVLSAHRNDNLAASLRTLCNELKAKEPQSERKRKKGSSRKEDKASSSNVIPVIDL